MFSSCICSTVFSSSGDSLEDVHHHWGLHPRSRHLGHVSGEAPARRDRPSQDKVTVDTIECAITRRYDLDAHSALAPLTGFSIRNDLLHVRSQSYLPPPSLAYLFVRAFQYTLAPQRSPSRLHPLFSKRKL